MEGNSLIICIKKWQLILMWKFANTGAESPWQNGICERNQSVIDLCVEKMIEDNRDLSIEVALAWAVNAKNAISNLHISLFWDKIQICLLF